MNAARWINNSTTKWNNPKFYDSKFILCHLVLQLHIHCVWFNRDQTASILHYVKRKAFVMLCRHFKRSCYKSAHIWCTTNYSHHLTYFMHSKMIRFDLCMCASKLTEWLRILSMVHKCWRFYARITLYWTFPALNASIHEINALIPFSYSVSDCLVRSCYRFFYNQKLKKLCDKAISSGFEMNFE